MSTLRDRRLQYDRASVQELIQQMNGRIMAEKIEGEPASSYVFAFHCRSVSGVQNGQPIFTNRQRVRVQLPAQYPAEPPQAVMLSAIFHPHVWPNQTICLGKWGPAEKLDSLVLRIAAILVFDPAQFNWKSVANHDAAVWVQQNQRLFPLDELFACGSELPASNRFTWSEKAVAHV